MNPITITLNQIAKYRPCKNGWEKALKALGKTEADDEPIPVSKFLDTNGLKDTLWALCCLPQYGSLWRLFAVWCAKQVEHLVTDERSKDALRVAERYALGEATKAELAAAWAAWAAPAAPEAAHAAADAAVDALDAAVDASGWYAALNAQAATLRRLLDTRTIDIEWNGTVYTYTWEDDR